MQFAQTELKAYCVDLSPCCFLPSFPPEALVQRSLQVSLHPDAVQTNRLQPLGKCGTGQQSGSLYLARDCRDLETNYLKESKVTINP